MTMSMPSSSTGVDSDVRRITRVASALRISEFDVFRLAYRNWYGRAAQENEITLIFDCYLRKTSVPLWVRDFTRKVQRLYEEGRLNPDEPDLTHSTPAPLPHYHGLIIGGIILILLISCIALLIYAAARAQDALQLQCMFPPCY